MHTNLNLDDDLMARAQRATGLKTKRDIVHEALRQLVAAHERVSLLELDGQIQFAPGYDHKALRDDGHVPG